MHIELDLGNFPDILRRYRKMRGYTQEQAAGLLDVSKQQYARYEKGEAAIEGTKLQLLVNYFQIPLLEWVTGHSEPSDILPIANHLAENLQRYIELNTAK